MVTIALVLITTVVLGTFGYLNYTSVRDRQWSMLHQEGTMAAFQLSTALSLPVWNMDDAQTNIILESAMHNHNISAVSVNASKRDYVTIRDELWGIKTADHVVPEPTWLLVEQPIHFGNEVIGTAKVYTNPQFIEQDLKRLRSSTVIFVIILDCILIGALFISLRISVLVPLKKIESYSLAVSSCPTGEATITGVGFRGELERVRISIEKMVGLLNARYVELMKTQNDLHNQAVLLEEEIAERQMAQEALQEQAVILEEEVEEHRRTEEALQQSEDTVKNKLRAILEPEGDIGTLELSEIVDCEMLQSMLEDFYRITGMLGAVLDVSGKVLVAIGWQDICTKFHRCHPDTLLNCIESDTNLTNDVPVGAFKHYRCKNNMWDMVTPLVVGGKHVGNVFIGQFFYEDEVPDAELFREQARRYGFDETEYLAALDRVPRFSRETADAGIKFYAKLTSMVSSLSFSSIKVSRMLNERILLEEQLRQSQKMEAVGQLAGGVAHDFNNLLQVISGYGHMLQMDGKLDVRQKEKIDHILSASEKAAQLTQGLLAFSRKQVITLTPANLNDIINNVKKFLVRIIGEDIQLKTIIYGNMLKIYADTGQIEQVLINLATNARDAMQKGGLLTIETGFQAVEASSDHECGRAEPGRYAVVTVSDTGSGMDDETRKRIFEPFYTTKEVGKGTGLGMSIVYGIVKQHNGFIDVHSDPGQGTTFRIYLPVYEVEQSEQEEKTEQVVSPQGGAETILLAEDDVDVRDLMVSLLARFGYNVIQAVDGQDVVEKFADHRDKVSIILMDMIMPKKNGKEAYEEIHSLKSDVKVLYTSGYTADFIQNRGVSEEGIELIMKPVQPMELLRKVREVLDR
jgi:polar amino acid transport system substrate-binding protein